MVLAETSSAKLPQEESIILNIMQWMYLFEIKMVLTSLRCGRRSVRLYCEVIKLSEGSCLREPSIVDVPFLPLGLVNWVLLVWAGPRQMGRHPGL